jgi:hypothetical protein
MGSAESLESVQEQHIGDLCGGELCEAEAHDVARLSQENAIKFR